MKNLEKIDIVGLPSGQIVSITTKQLSALIKQDLVLKVKRYKNIDNLNKYCFEDKDYDIVILISISYSY